MALETRRPSRTDEEIREDVEARVARLMKLRDDPVYQAQRLAELKQRVEAYELQFGMASEDVHAAIDAGTLVEDLDVCNWLMDFHQLQRLGVR